MTREKKKRLMKRDVNTDAGNGGGVFFLFVAMSRHVYVKT